MYCLHDRWLTGYAIFVPECSLNPTPIKNRTCYRVEEHSCKANIHLLYWSRLSLITMYAGSVLMPLGGGIPKLMSLRQRTFPRCNQNLRLGNLVRRHRIWFWQILLKARYAFNPNIWRNSFPTVLVIMMNVHNELGMGYKMVSITWGNIQN